ncbi:MAG: Ig-like domain-containing protein [Planctomycetes bacterium]|nr:Ig-like domain-containing protein [Planctomycetota bacterium]
MTRLLIVLLLACLASVQAADITLSVPGTAQTLGSTFTVTVQVANAGPFANWGAYVTFDKTKVQLTAQSTGTFTTFVQDSRGLAAINAAGDVRTGGFGFADNAGGSGTLAVLTFQAIGAGSASFATAAKSGATPFGCVLTTAAGTDTLPTIPPASTVTVNGSPLTITVNNATRAYGDANPAFSVTYAGFQGADNASSMTGTLVFATAATPASPIGAYPVTASGLSHPNYTITYVAGTLTVSPAATAVTWANPSAITYGTALSATQLNAATGVAGTFVYTPAAGAVPHAGTQTLQVSFTPASGNYLASTGSASLVVNQAPLTVTAAAASRAFGLANPTFTASYTGFVNGDTAAVIDVAPTLSCAATTTSALGTYPITVTGGSDADYAFTRVDGVLTVTGATPVLTWATPAAITYGTALSATQLNATANTPGTFAYSPALGAVLGAGSQSLAVTFTPTDAVNYSTATASVTLTVNQATQTIAGFSAFGTRTYGDAPISLAGVTGGASTQVLTFASSDPVATVAGSTVTIVGSGSAVITASQAGDANFTAATAVPQTLTVGKAALSVTAADATRAVGTANPVFTGTLTGVVAGDAITATYASTATAATPVGTYGPSSPEAITPTLVDPGNRLGHYTVTSTKGTLSVVAGLAVSITRSGSGTPNVASHPAETITVTFSEAVTGFADGELTLTGGGTLGALAGSGAVYTATWTPPVGSEGAATFAVAAGVATGATLNNLAGSLAVGYDTLAPGAPTITAPLAGATVGGAFTASGALPSGATALSINGLSATVTGSAWTRAFSGLTSGALALTAHALDAAGNVGPDVVVNVTVDYSPPALTVAPLATPSASRIQVLTGTTDDAAATITVFDGATTLVATQPTAGLSWSATTAALADGVHSLTVTATDTLGNATTSAAIPLTVDATGPVATFATPSATVVKPGDAPTIAVTYADAISSVAAITLAAGNVTVTRTGTATAAATVSGSGLSTRTITLSGISGDGTLTVSLVAGTASDTLGNLAASAGPSPVITVATPVVAVPVLPISTTSQAAALAAASSGSSDKKLLGCGMGSGLGLIAGACALLMLSLRRRRN